MLANLFCVIRHDTALERVQKLERAESAIGRSEDCEIWLPESFVSRKHAMIQLTTDGALIRDLDSRNGTYVNGRPVRETQALRDGDRIEIGAYSLKGFYSIGDALREFATLDLSTMAQPERGDSEGRPLFGATPELTPAQCRVFEGFVAGLSEKEVARRLGISIHTVHTHAKAIYKSFEISSRAELLERWASRRELNDA